jgi:hypothetical protein
MMITKAKGIGPADAARWYLGQKQEFTIDVDAREHDLLVDYCIERKLDLKCKGGTSPSGRYTVLVATPNDHESNKLSAFVAKYTIKAQAVYVDPLKAWTDEELRSARLKR